MRRLGVADHVQESLVDAVSGQVDVAVVVEQINRVRWGVDGWDGGDEWIGEYWSTALVELIAVVAGNWRVVLADDLDGDRLLDISYIS